MTLRIGIDLQSTVGRKSGLGHYVENLYRALLQEMPQGLELVAIYQEQRKDFNTLQRLWWENITLPRNAKKQKVALLHVPAFAPPLHSCGKVVVTVHDVIGALFPNQMGLASRLYWGKWLPYAIRRAGHIIADSRHTKHDICRLTGIPKDRIDVIYASGHEGFSRSMTKTDMESVKARYALRDKYFIFVGTLEPRKNLKRVVEAFARFKRDARHSEYQLILVGSKGFAHGHYYRALLNESVLKSGDLVFTDYVSHQELNALYCGAEALVFASLYEGFGIPVLEAMACGTPVIASDRTSVPEVGGAAALYVNPENTEDIAAKMREIAGGSDLRAELVERGFAQIKKFSWRETAQRTMQVYHRVLMSGKK
ncbi:MAG: hypothetical protein A2Z83_05935 [Omnitrophica bacterium GWA2_52_8]|nr:MAG: hypothetical protein A2Z83_05935 [Omnitrophica bacterium GWA2_52_8]